MTAVQITLLVAYACGMAAGQLLFKLAASGLQRLPSPSDAPVEWLAGVLGNPWFVAAMAAYGFLSVVWVWLLGFVPLSRAYPFVALAFVLVPVLGHFVFGDPLSPRFLAGTALIAVGLSLVAR